MIPVPWQPPPPTDLVPSASWPAVRGVVRGHYDDVFLLALHRAAAENLRPDSPPDVREAFAARACLADADTPHRHN